MTTPDGAPTPGSLGASGDDVLAAVVPRLLRLGTAMGRSDLYERAVEAAGVPVERPAISVLMTLRAADAPLRVGEIAERQGVVGPHVTRTVTELERRGLVRRVVDPADRRARLVEPTEEGTAAVGRYLGVVLGGFTDVLADWSAEDRADAARLLTRLLDDLVRAFDP